MRRCFVILLLFGFAVSSHSVSAQNRTGNRAAILKALLQRFPDADTNGDGTLTEQEVRTYRDRQSQNKRPTNEGSERVAPTHADVNYGDNPRQVLDLYLAKSARPTPLIIYIHGGGFVGGDKRSVSSPLVQAANEAGISVAAIHYRFVTEAPFPAPQQDAARAVQFLRAHAEKWNLDKQRFAAYGGSAGAGLSLWLGFHDDLADPNSDDPVERESTRLMAIGSFGGQTTYDPNIIKNWIGGRAYEHPSIYLCYNIESIDQIDDPELQPLYDEVSAIHHLTQDDPPVYMVYSEADGPLPENARPGQGIHHPAFARKLIDEMDKLGIESVYRHSRSFKGDRNLDLLAHLKTWLKVEPGQEK